jgi:hypothetical protein
MANRHFGAQLADANVVIGHENAAGWNGAVSSAPGG